MEASHLDYALFYAGLGWQIFPVHSIVDVDQCSCGDGGCSDRGKHPITINGLKSATDDEEQIRAWWGANPEANIGVATGEASQVWALDVDTREDGFRNFHELLVENGCEELPRTVEQVTGSGGRHFIFGWPGEAGEVRNRTNIVRGVDVRGEGGYVIVPPSTHISGRSYQWEEHGDPGAIEAAATPDWLLGMVLAEGAANSSNGPRGVAPAILTGALPPREVRSIRSALLSVDPNCDHETWYRIGMALESTHAGDQAFAIWDEWSARADRARGSDPRKPAYPGAPALRRRWNSFGRRAHEVRLPTLYHIALEAGWEGTPPEDVQDAVHVEPEAPSMDQPPEWIWEDSETPTFPVETAFPESLAWLREWVEALSYTFQVPAGFPASMALAMSSGTVAGKAVVRLPAAEWVEQAPLWVVCAMPSGTLKSQVFRPLIDPFRVFQKGLDDHRARAEYEAQLKLVDMQVRQAESELAKKGVAPDGDPVAGRVLEDKLTSAMARREMAIATVPQSLRVLLSDATTEAMVEFLEEHYGRALLADPEGGVFDHALGSKSRAARLDPWLKAYGGETIDERRIGNALSRRSRGRYVESPLVSIAVCTQPGALAEMLTNPMADAKGFLARFLTVVIPPELPEVFVRETELPVALAAKWRAAIDRLLRAVPPTEPAAIPLSPEAQAAFFDWGGAKLDAARRGDIDDAETYLSAWERKFPGMVLRVALTLHALGSESFREAAIGEETMRAALVWASYLEANQALLAGVTRNDPDLRIAERILRWIERHGHEGTEFTRSDLFRNLGHASRGHVKKVDDLNGALAALVEAGWIWPVGTLKRRKIGVASAARYLARPDLGEHLRRFTASEVRLGRSLKRSAT